MANEEDTKEVIYQLLERERELNSEEVRKIEFQRIHGIGKKSNDIRPIITRFLRFQDREYILKRAKEMSSSLDFKVLVEMKGNQGSQKGAVAQAEEGQGRRQDRIL